MIDVAQIERALKDADRYIGIMDDENRWPDTPKVRDQITTALINLRKVPTPPSVPDSFHAGAEPEGWQPMETAPKDGTRFLALCGDDRIKIIFRHDPGGEKRNPKHHYECWTGDDGSSYVKPFICWQPLPPTPTLKGEKA